MKNFIGFVSIDLVLAMLLAVSATHAEAKPIWTMALRDPLLTADGNPDQRRSCGIARWDRTHVLIYFLTSVKNLVVRKPGERPGGSWSFSVQIVRSDNGEVEQSSFIPADGVRSELAVVAGGIVVSNRDQLVFYSRNFERMERDFRYAPLDTATLPLDYAFSDLEYLYATDDQKQFVLVDNKGYQSHFFQFDGTTLERERDWILSGVDTHSIKISEGRILYGKLLSANEMSMTSNFYWTNLDGGSGAPQIMSTASDDMICRIPVSIEAGIYLDTCGSVQIILPTGSEIIYRPKKNEGVGFPEVAAPDKSSVVIFDYDQKGGGVFDLTERRNRVALLVVNLDAAHHVCKIPIVPLPKSQLAFQFADDSTLIVVNDATVTAYRMPCAE